MNHEMMSDRQTGIPEDIPIEEVVPVDPNADKKPEVHPVVRDAEIQRITDEEQGESGGGYQEVPFVPNSDSDIRLP